MREPVATILFLAVTGGALPAAESPRYGVGHAPSTSELSSSGVSVFPDGKGLPAGQGSAREGRQIYRQRCRACHGENARGDENEALVGGRGSLVSARPRRTVESYWPYATTLWDYTRRAMPFNDPGSLSDSEVYAVTAYVLHLAGLVGEDEVIDRDRLPRVEMPNRDGFIADPRPDVDPE